MDEPRTTSTLWDYRRRIADLYGQVRTQPDPTAAWQVWRDGRDRLFASHPQSPIPAHERISFEGLSYFEYDPKWRLSGAIVNAEMRTLAVAQSGDGVFLPFRDATSGDATYGGGRYLLDTAKGADLGHDADAATVVLDFNLAYHPSCVHNPRWSCPLAPEDNRLPLRIEAGERLP